MFEKQSDTYHMAINMTSLGVHVIGMHPHLSQPHARYRNSLVAFSLGNLLFPSTLTNKFKMYSLQRKLFSSESLENMSSYGMNKKNEFVRQTKAS